MHRLAPWSRRVRFYWPMLSAGLLSMPGETLAHSAERGLVMLLPTGYYLGGAATAVACSFLLLWFAPTKVLQQIATARLRLFQFAPLSPLWTSWASCLLMLVLLLSGFLGSRDPLSNPLPLTVWTGFWVGLTMLQVLVGNLWSYLNPWSGPLRLLAALVGWRQPPLRLSEKLGYCPAIVIFFAFAWFEIVDLAPEDPARLALVASGYWLLNLFGMLVFGERDWRQRAEPFAIFFSLVGTCSPLVRETALDTPSNRDLVTLYLAWPGQGFLKLAPMSWSGVVFVLLTLSSVSFDGFAKTFAWLHTIGINPLAFPGRNAVQLQNSLGLIVALVLLVGLFLVAVDFGRHFVYPGINARHFPDRQLLAGRLVYSIVPISIVFHVAHYLTLLLVNGQYLYYAVGDPFDRGWRVLGIEPAYVTTSFLTDLHSVYTIWTIQTVIVTLGHVIGITVAHCIALQVFGLQNNPLDVARKSQLLLALLMIGYTVFGLWLLSTPAI